MHCPYDWAGLGLVARPWPAESSNGPLSKGPHQLSKGPHQVIPRVVTFGEIMLRLTPQRMRRLDDATAFDAGFGGGEANVAVSLARLGTPVTFVTRLPVNEFGEAAIERLRALGVDTSETLWGGERIGIYFLEEGASVRPSKVLYDRAGSGFAEISPGMVDWARILSGAGWFHLTGITPAISQSAAETALDAVNCARAAGATVSVDLNFRAKLWRWGRSASDVMDEIVRRADVIVGNEEDADKVFGIDAPGVDVRSGSVDPAAYEEVFSALFTRFPAVRTIAFTLRGSISASHNRWSAVLAERSGGRYAGQSYDIIPIVDRVGTGDSFCAGLIHCLLVDPAAPGRALAFAVASSALSHTLRGDFKIITRGEVENLLAGDASGRVER